MPRRSSRTAPVVIVPGWHGSGAGHWQAWLASELRTAGRDVRWPDFPDLDNPELPGWLMALRIELAGLPDAGYDVLAHSLGAVLWLHHVGTTSDAPRAGRVLLVAPPSPQLELPGTDAFFPPPMDIDTVRHSAEGTILVAGDDDPYLPEGVAAAYATPLKMPVTIVAAGGHLNIDSGYGPWPAVLDWCGRDNLAFY